MANNRGSELALIAFRGLLNQSSTIPEEADGDPVVVTGE